MISLERQVRIAAGSLVVLGIVLGATVNPGFYGLRLLLAQDSYLRGSLTVAAWG